MRYQAIQWAQRILLTISLVALIGIMVMVARIVGYAIPGLNSLLPQRVVSAAFAKKVALISGHAGSDSGAVCTDSNGNTTITEAAINATVTELAAERLRRAGADVLILQEFDPRLAGLQASVLLSLHADSCIDASGYKAAHHPLSPLSTSEDQLVACINHFYPAATGLTEHSNTITHNMTDYHAFRVIDRQTPAAIMEMGFLGGDQDLLVNHPEIAAQGIADSLLCFLQQESEPNPASSEP